MAEEREVDRLYAQYAKAKHNERAAVQAGDEAEIKRLNAEVISPLMGSHNHRNRNVR